MNSFIIIFILVVTIFTLLLIFLLSIPHILKRKRLKRYVQIYPDMLEEDMLAIMGKGYNKSTLKNNTYKYEWRMNATKTQYSYSGVRKVDIYVKDGKVTEIKPYNV